MSEENQAIIKALNMYGRVPKQWELLNEIERLNNIIKEVREYIEGNLTEDNNGCGCWWYGFEYYVEAKQELLEILKGSDE